jgi:hypothetical protein
MIQVPTQARAASLDETAEAQENHGRSRNLGNS